MATPMAIHWESLGHPWEILAKSMGNPWEILFANPWEMLRISFGNHLEILNNSLGISWGILGTIIGEILRTSLRGIVGKLLGIMRKPLGNPWEALGASLVNPLEPFGNP